MLGIFVSLRIIDGKTFIVANCQGRPMEHEVHPWRKDADGKDVGGCKVTLNGADAALEDLRAGDKLDIDGNPAVKVTATRVAAVKAATKEEVKTPKLRK